MGDTPTIDSPKSFMQNIMAFARAQGITTAEISRISGIDDANLAANALVDTPYPLLGKMAKSVAEELIILVAPEVLHDHFRKLKGYYERSIDEAVQEIISNSPDDAGRRALAGKSFGELFRFNREQRLRGGRLLLIKDCAPESMGTATFSKMERGHYSPLQSDGLPLLSHLGHPPTLEGLESFCEETASLLNAHKIRSEQFGRALFAHMNPDGLKRVGGSVRKTDITAALHTSNNTINKMLNGSQIPTESEVAIILPFFKISDEEQFYKSANGIYHMQPGLKPPKPEVPSTETARFGLMVKAVREELSISQGALEWRSQLRKPPELGEILSNTVITYLESGKRKQPLAAEERLGLIKALGFEDEATFTSIATQAQDVQEYRKIHFLAALKTLAHTGYQKAQYVVAKNYRIDHYTPFAARTACKDLGISEAELYQMTTANIPDKIIDGCDEIERFAAQFDYAPYSPLGEQHIQNDRIGRRGSIGKG